MTALDNDDSAWNTVERLIAEVEREATPQVCDKVRSLVGAVLELHAQGLRQMLQLVDTTTQDAAKVRRAFGHNAPVNSLLALHELHGTTAMERAQEVVDSLQGPLKGFAVELQADPSQELHVRVTGPEPVPAHLKQTLERAVAEAVPELAAVHVHEVMAKRERLPIVRGASQ